MTAARQSYGCPRRRGHAPSLVTQGATSALTAKRRSVERSPRADDTKRLIDYAHMTTAGMWRRVLLEEWRHHRNVPARRRPRSCQRRIRKLLSKAFTAAPLSALNCASSKLRQALVYVLAAASLAAIRATLAPVASLTPLHRRGGSR